MREIKKHLVAYLLQNPDQYPEFDGFEAVDFVDNSDNPAPFDRLFAAAIRLLKDGVRPDSVLLASETKLGPDYIKKYFDLDVQAESVPSYIAALEDEAKLRRVREAGRRLLSASANDLPTAIEMAEKTLRQMGHEPVRADIGGVMAGYLEKTANMLGVPEKDRVIRFKMDVMTNYVGGLYPGKMYLLGARPGMGKTTLLSQWREDLLRDGYGVVSFALEMGTSHLLERLLAGRMRIPVRDIIEMRLREDQLGEFYKVAAEVGGWNWRIFDSEYADFRKMRSALESILVNNPPHLVDIDFIQQVREGMGTNSAERLASVVGELITMVNNSPAALIIASQVDRGLDKALNHRPDLSSFKGSGGLEEGADVAMALYRPKFYDPSMDDSAELIVLKNRLGPLGTINLVADLARFRFLPASTF